MCHAAFTIARDFYIPRADASSEQPLLISGGREP
jgi:hypothetical protein